ncbi:MAG TPA: hypothetical protein VE954_39580 [Oligoflexus sp.]|uniref:hypothetical protein n=1 Tax=Oligoflexus sp. TaxID=1971216 RepID=UPI002D3426DB|nr:hypothetical protein [Oligoflexus sp.]HYX39242.1 hypothetical protein [Oligoflexus sp.]
MSKKIFGMALLVLVLIVSGTYIYKTRVAEKAVLFDRLDQKETPLAPSSNDLSVVDPNIAGKTLKHGSENKQKEKSIVTEEVEGRAISAPPRTSAGANKDAFFRILANKLSANGFSDSIQNCIERHFQENLKLTKPLSSEQIVENCGRAADLPDSDLKNINQLLSSTFKESQNPVDVVAWFECSLKKSFSGTSPCFREKMKKAIDQFYGEASVDGPKMSSETFDSKWSSKVEVVTQQIANECPSSDLDFLSEVALHECKY